MNIKKILISALVSIPVCVGLRFYQIFETIDYENGFFTNEKTLLGYLLLFAIFSVCAMVGVISFKTTNVTLKEPKTSWAMAILAIAVSAKLFGELFGEVMSFSIPAWQILLVKLITVATMIYFLLIFLQKIIDFKIPPLLHIIPALYAITKTIFTFINISALSVISDNVILMACYCVLMLFFINYARIYNEIQVESATKKVVCYGFISVILCLTATLPTIIINSFSNTPYLHSNSSVNNTLLSLASYILVFLGEYLYKKEEHID